MVSEELTALEARLWSDALLDREIAAAGLLAAGRDGARVLASVAVNTAAPPPVRVTALRHLLADADATEALRLLLADALPVLRVAALTKVEQARAVALVPLVEQLTRDSATFWDLDEEIAVAKVAERVLGSLSSGPNPQGERATATYRHFCIKLCYRTHESIAYYEAVVRAAVALRSSTVAGDRIAELAALYAGELERSATVALGSGQLAVTREPDEITVRLDLPPGGRDPVDELTELLETLDARYAPAIAMLFAPDGDDHRFLDQGLHRLDAVPPVCFFDWQLVGVLDNAEALRKLASSRPLGGGLFAVVRPVFASPIASDRARVREIAEGLRLPRSLYGMRAEPADRDKPILQIWRAGMADFNGVAASPDGVWAVGEGGALWCWLGGDDDDDHWQDASTEGEWTLYAVAGDKDVAWVVGDDGAILVCEGDWEWHSVGMRAFRGVDILGGDVIAAGDGGQLAEIDRIARRPRLVRSGTDRDLHAVSKRWVVGAAGTILRRGEDGTWSRVAAAIDVDLHGVSALGDEAWIVGDRGMILRASGGGIAQIPSGVDVALRGVSAFAPDDIWAVGDGGTVLSWDGSRWSVFDRDDQTRLRAVSAAGPHRAWAVGTPAIVLRLQRRP